MQLNGDQKNFELLHLLRLNGHVGTITTCFVSFEINFMWRRNLCFYVWCNHASYIESLLHVSCSETS